MKLSHFLCGDRLEQNATAPIFFFFPEDESGAGDEAIM